LTLIFRLALINYKFALSIFKQIGYKNGIASVLSNIGIGYYQLSNFQLGFEYFSKALELCKANENMDGILKNLSLIGTLFHTFERYDEALDIHKKALQIANKLNNKSDIALQLGNIGITQLELINYTAAITNLKESIELFYNINDMYNYSICCGNLGIAYSKIKMYDKALEYYNYALNYSLQVDDRFGIAYQYGNMGTSILEKYVGMRDKNSLPIESKLLIEAEDFLVKSVKKFEALNALEDQRYFSSKLAEVYKAKKEYKKALHIYKQVSILKDSIFSTNVHMKITEGGVKQIIDMEKKESKSLNRKDHYQVSINDLFLVLEIVLILLAIFFTYLYFSRKYRLDLLEENVKLRRDAERALLKDIEKLKRT